MKESIIHYLRVYKKFIETSFSVDLSFRVNFILMVVMDLFFYLSTLATVSFIYDHVSVIGPWDKNQLMFFITFMLCVDQFHMTFISESFWRLPHDIRQGQMDYTILRPLSTIFSTFFRHARPSSMCNTPVIWSVLIYYGLQVKLSTLSWVMLPVVFLLAFILLAIIEFIVSSWMFWLTEGVGLNFLRMQMQQLSRWPDFIYGTMIRRVFTIFIPLLMIGSYPVKFLFSPNQWHLIFILVVAIVVSAIVLRMFWHRGLRNYESASS